MRFSVLASGSRANCSFIEAGGARFLVDCGLSGKQVELRLGSLGISADSLDALIVTHEHRDHIHGISVLSRRYRLPVYCNEAVVDMLGAVHGLELFATGDRFSIADTILHPFRIVHDAVDPVGFEITAEGLKLTHVTDLGRVTPLVRDALAGANAIVLESNYDRELLQICDYPWELKQRIASSHGHLGNIEAAACLREMIHSELTQVVLAHLSENSNTPEAALTTVQRALEPLGFRDVTCGCPTSPTPLYQVGETGLRAAV